ncbi:MAG TPA: serine/threonine-protein kinase [Bryobacteraceae bacterium]|nr:serine/threonine-protein kinase [Bryobacteraceae bacterium]
MLADRWPQIDEIIEQAMDQPAADRAAFLDAACGSDTRLRREIDSLLAFHQEGSLTSESGFPDAMNVLEKQYAGLIRGHQIGAYRVLREIGRGGMGNVYLASRADDAFEKRVAIKVIRRGMDVDDLVQRFRDERRILALLDHPNIARLLDGGTTDDGLPYFVMEYIEGEPIDKYCESQKLSTTERLRLFQNVCAAVSYAHRNLIVHRDIKAANVLVTKEGAPRLLDFGIAKLLAPGAPVEITQISFRPLTPEYASPEQLQGGPITTASDIYSLGVLLYRLLTGRRPYRSATSSVAEMERAICEEEPVRPDLSRDLSAVVLTALRKDPQRRYTSVERFSDDVRRYLANLPVMARPDTRRYRASKFIQRHKAAVAMAAITFLSLSGGIAASLWQAHIAQTEQVKTARMNSFLQDMVSGTWRTANQKGMEATVADMLAEAEQRVETELSDQPEVKAEMLLTIGEAYQRQAKYDMAERYLRKAYELDLKLYGSDARPTATAMHALAGDDYLLGDYAAANAWFQKALPVYRRHVNDATFEMRQMPAILSDAAFAARAVGRLDEAEALWREALAYNLRVSVPNRASVSGTIKTFLAQLYVDRGEISKADSLASEAVRELRGVRDRPSLAQALIDLGNIRRLQGRYVEADASLQEGTKLYEKAQGSDHPNVAYGLISLATSRYYQGKYDLAEKDARRANEIVAKHAGGSHYHQSAYIALGLILSKTGAAKEAEPLLRAALSSAQQKSRRLDVAFASGALGECLAAQERYSEAEPLLMDSSKILQTIQVSGSPALSEAHERLEALYKAWGKP